MERLSLSTICEGAAVERFDYELQKVLEDINDLNTQAEATREITLTVKIKPNEDRTTYQPSLAIKSKMAGLQPVTSIGAMGKSIDGKAEAYEYARPKQQEFGFEGNVTPIKKEGHGND